METQTTTKRPRSETAKAISKLNALQKKRAKVQELDDKIEAQKRVVAALLGIDGTWSEE